MLHRDFLMRQIQQAVQVMMHALAQVLRLKSEERHEEALQAIRDVFRESEIWPRPVGELSADELVELCRTERGFAVDLALSTADLLREQAELLDAEGDERAARTSAAKACALYDEALRTEGAALPMDLAQRMARAEELAQSPR